MVLDVDLVLKYGQGGVLLGELYENLREIEVSLQRFLRGVLVDAFGPDEGSWWVQGIPQGVWIKCQERRESDSARLDPYCYTELHDLYGIIDKRWSLLGEIFSPLAKLKRMPLTQFIGSTW